MGILITNGEFVSFHGPDPTMVRVTENHTGTVRFNNCAFWGPANRNAVIEGHGTVGFSDCTFMQWGYRKGDTDGAREDAPSIEVRSGSVLVRGCEFLEDKPQVYLGPEVERAVVCENMVNGKERIEDDSDGNTVVKHNVDSPGGRAWEKRYEDMPGFRAQQLRKRRD